MVAAVLRRSLIPAALVALLALLVAVPASAQLRYLGDKGLATVGKVACPGKPRCALKTPKRVKAKVGQKNFWAQVRAPKRIAGGAKATVRVKFGRGAVTALAGRTTTINVKTIVRREGKGKVKWLKVRLRRAALTGQPGGPGGAPTSGSLGNEPPVLARPATAVDVSGVAVTWYPRDSWVRYVSSEAPIGFGNGAAGINSTESPCPVAPSPQSPPGLPFTMTFTPRPSWYDAATQTAGIYGQGDVNFRYPERGIDLTASDPEVEILGGTGRMIFRFNGTQSTPFPNQRAVLVDLDLSGQPAITNGGKTFSYAMMPSRITEDGFKVFAGFYQPQSSFGCASVSFTAP